MLLQAVLVPESQDDRRAFGRQAVNQPSTLRQGAAACDVYVRELSASGFSVATDARLTIGSTVTIGLPRHGRAAATVVRAIEGGYGCAFAAPLAPDVVAQTFRGGTVIRLTSSGPIVMPPAEPVLARWPGAVRLALIAGSSAMLWTLIAEASARLI